ncbi:hypothetical protein OG978_01620 [Streptomyces sp. NBC_01591]|uniref:hypothetical protein n=1 Tax=Streptomyces sp. NBC_01591 TaxID=2975888 RepID=UPI002DDC50FF|nr:hypothetical protein [Streptomyces sp. NBC_01591]WSD66241.1 hypothetical protein OG978_01620 [Streptomyces sp. NBC_01591]
MLLTEAAHALPGLAHAHANGELLPGAAPAYLSDHQVANTLTPLYDETGIGHDHGFGARRYALTSDRRRDSRFR